MQQVNRSTSMPFPDREVPHQAGAGDGLPIDSGLGEIIAAVARHKLALFGTILGSLLLAGLALYMVTPRYSAETMIMIEPKTSNIVSVEAVVAGLSGDEESIQSETYVLSSRELAGRVIQRLNLHEDPEFNPEGMPSNDVMASGLSAELSAVVNRFLKRLTVIPLDTSRVISVSFSSESAEKAAIIANVLADEYIVSRLEAKFESTRRANAWLGVRIDELRDELMNAERAVETARARFGLLQGDGMTLASQELIELNTQLVLARSERAEAAARLGQIKGISSSRRSNNSLDEVLNSSLIQRLREQESEVERRVAELSSEYGELHPKMIQLRAEAKDIQSRIGVEIDKVVAGLRSRLAVAQAREESLQRSLEELKSRAAIGNQNEIELRALEREAEANRGLLATMLSRQKETLSQEDADYQQADARIISAADMPIEPTYPRVGVVLGLVLIASSILGLIVVLVIELLDDGFRSGDELERATGVPSIGFVPLVPDIGSYKSLAGYVSGKPNTAFGESIRTLNWSIGLAFPAPAPKSVLVTSSVPGEGKTTIATCLATSQSVAGRLTVLIDADTRRPCCHELLGVPREPGLVDVLTGTANLDDVLVDRNWSGLVFLPAGSPSPNAPNLLDSQKMRELLEEMNRRFDFIVMDSPPVMATTDARILCQMVDATVVAIKWGETRRAVVRNTLGQLLGARARLAGSLLSMVDARKHAKYGYGDSGAYTGDLEKYYAG